MPRFRYGWKRQEHDPRDYHYIVAPRITRHLPAAMDLSAGMGPQLDQGSLGSCGPNTVDECVTFDAKAQNKLFAGASRLFIYYNARAAMGTVNQDSGVDNRTMLASLAKYGFCPESLWPYNVAKFKKKPPASCYAAALPEAIRNYAAVQQSLDQMKGCIVSGHPFIFGFRCFSGIESAAAAKTGVIPDPQAGEQSIGGHDVSIVGFDDNGFGKLKGGAFKIRNHWMLSPTQPWGDNGYGYISYAYATNPQLAGDFWVINAIP